MKKLIVTADDFGASQNINEGIIEGVENGIVTTISAMTNFHEPLSMLPPLRKKNNVNVGVHLNITTGKGLTTNSKSTLCDNSGCFFSISEILPKLKQINISELETELTSQIEILEKYNISPEHLTNQHGILSLYPPFFSVVVKLAKKYNLPVRSPITTSTDFSSFYPDSETRKFATKLFLNHIKKYPLTVPHLAKNILKKRKFPEILKKNNIKTPDIFIDYLWGKPSEEKLIYILENLQEGISEMTVHLGNSFREKSYPKGLDTEYFYNREIELKLVTSSKIKNKISELGIKLANFESL